MGNATRPVVSKLSGGRRFDNSRSVNLPWNRTLPTGDALEKEAARMGVSLHEIYKGGAQGKTVLDEPELQSRLLAARNDRRNAILNWTQTLALVGALLVSVIVSLSNRRVQENQTSADFMLRFSDELDEDGSGRVVVALDRGRPLTSDHDVSDDDLDDFLSKYESLDDVYNLHLINREMAQNAFSYSLEKALKDQRVVKYLQDSMREESDLYDGVGDLARAWGIKFPAQIQAFPIVAPK